MLSVTLASSARTMMKFATFRSSLIQVKDTCKIVLNRKGILAMCYDMKGAVTGCFLKLYSGVL